MMRKPTAWPYLKSATPRMGKVRYEDGYRQKNLEESIAAHTAQVEEHARKVQNPDKYDVGWSEKDDRQKQGLLKKWGKDLLRNAEQAEIEIEVWKERFGNEQ